MPGILSAVSSVSSLIGLFGNPVLSVGDVLFTDMEVPEHVGPLGGNLRLAVHEFPGGLRTGQTFGAFNEPISWSGILRGGAALLRLTQIDRLRVSGQLCPFIYGMFKLKGYVRSFHANPHHQWHVPYTIIFEPITDAPNPNASAGSNNSPEAVLNDQVSTLNGYQNGDPVGTPPTMAAPVDGFLGQVGSGMQEAAGVVSQVTSEARGAILGAAQEIYTAASPILFGAASILSSPALAIVSRARIVGFLVQGRSRTPPRQIRVMNPDLMSLSAQHYRDASKWRTIAAANGLNDPQPIGNYVLTIPNPSSVV